MSAFETAVAAYREYERRLRATAPGVADRLAPPHPNPAAAVADAFPGLTLPDTLVAWWSWHDGMAPPEGYAPTIGPHLRFFSLSQTLEIWRRALRGAELAAEPPAMPAESFWPRTWMPVVSNENFALAVDLSPQPTRGGVIFKEVDVMSHHAPTIAADLVAVVSWWTTLLHDQATTWERQPSGRMAWVSDPSRVPAHLRGNPAAYDLLEDPRDPKYLPLAAF